MSLAQPCPAVPADKQSCVMSTAEAVRAAVYLEFLYGFGAAPGIDLGMPMVYSRILTVDATLYRQEFERGVTIANIGDDAVDLALEPPLYDLENALLTTVHLRGHSAEVLLTSPRAGEPGGVS